MDFFSHGLWTGFLCKEINRKVKPPLRLWRTVFWGVFPDIVSFTILIGWSLWKVFIEGVPYSRIRRPSSLEPVPELAKPIYRITSFLYHSSHSLIVFLLIFGLVFLLLRKPVWELSGWLFHVLLDIPSHSYKFYPTPFLWPVSSWRFDGISWKNPWFLAINYLAIIIVYFKLRKRKEKR